MLLLYSRVCNIFVHILYISYPKHYYAFLRHPITPTNRYLLPPPLINNHQFHSLCLKGHFARGQKGIVLERSAGQKGIVLERSAFSLNHLQAISNNQRTLIKRQVAIVTTSELRYLQKIQQPKLQYTIHIISYTRHYLIVIYYLTTKSSW